MIKVWQKRRVSQASGAVSTNYLLEPSRLTSNKPSHSVDRVHKKSRPQQEEIGEAKRRPNRPDIKGKKDSRYYTEEVPCNAFMIDREKYLSYGYKGLLKAIFEHLTKPRLFSLDIKNSELAEEVGASVRTVTSVTDKLHRDGIVEKYSTGIYSVNTYIVSEELTKDGPLSTSLWKSRLSDKEREDLDMFEFLPGGHFSKKFRANLEEIERSGFTLDNGPICQLYSTYNFIVKLNKSTSREIKRNVKRHFVNGRSKYPVSRGIEMNKKDLNFNDIGFSGVMTSIASKFELNSAQKLKLLAFPISCLESVFEKIEAHLSLKGGYESFIYKCIAHCSKRSMKPDWSRYTVLCKEYGFQPELSGVSKRPIYTAYVPEEEESLVYLLNEEVSWRETIEEFESKPDPFGMLAMARNRLAAVESELEERIGEGETIH